MNFYFGKQYTKEELRIMSLTVFDKILLDAVDYIDRKAQYMSLVKKQTDMNWKEKYNTKLPTQYSEEYDLLQKETNKKLKENKDIKQEFGEKGNMDIVLCPNWSFAFWIGIYERQIASSFSFNTVDFANLCTMAKKDSLFRYICTSGYLKLEDYSWKKHLPQLNNDLDYYSLGRTITARNIYCEYVKTLLFNKFFYCCEKTIIPNDILVEFLEGKIDMNSFRIKIRANKNPMANIGSYDIKTQAKLWGLREGDTAKDFIKDKRDVSYLLEVDDEQMVEQEKETMREKTKESLGNKFNFGKDKERWDYANKKKQPPKKRKKPDSMVLEEPPNKKYPYDKAETIILDKTLFKNRIDSLPETMKKNEHNNKGLF